MEPYTSTYFCNDENDVRELDPGFRDGSIPDRHTDMEDLLGHTFEAEAVWELRRILIDGINDNDLLKRMLEMTAARLGSYDKAHLENAKRDTDFFRILDTNQYDTILAALLYFIMEGDMFRGITFGEMHSAFTDMPEVLDHWKKTESRDP